MKVGRGSNCPPPPGKTTLKKPSLIRVELSNILVIKKRLLLSSV